MLRRGPSRNKKSSYRRTVEAWWPIVVQMLKAGQMLLAIDAEFPLVPVTMLLLQAGIRKIDFWILNHSI